MNFVERMLIAMKKRANTKGQSSEYNVITSAIPPVPPGIDANEWNECWSKRALGVRSYVQWRGHTIAEFECEADAQEYVRHYRWQRGEI